MKGWKQLFAALEVKAQPLVLPHTVNPNIFAVYGKMLGVKLSYRRRPDGFHVWRLE